MDTSTSILEHIKKREMTKQVIDKRVDIKENNIVFSSSGHKIILEHDSKSNGAILGRVEAVVMVLNEKSQNGTFYDDSWYEKAIEKNQVFQERLSRKLILGELDHPKDPGTAGQRTAFAIVELNRKGNDVWAILEMFNTPNGRILWTLLEADVRMGFSLRGLGNDYYDSGVMKIEGEGFDMKGWDAVVDPSFVRAEFKNFTEEKRNTFLSQIVKEGNNNISHLILESVDSIKQKEIKEKNVQFENVQLKKLVEKQQKKIISLDFMIKEHQSEKDALNSKILKLENNNNIFKETMNQKNAILESKQKTVLSSKNKEKELLDKIELFKEEIKEKELLVEKYKNKAEEINKKSDEDKIEIFIEKTKNTKKNKESFITSALSKRKYTTK